MDRSTSEKGERWTITAMDRASIVNPSRREKSRDFDRWRGWQNERNAKRARPVVTWKGPQWLSTGRTHLIHDLISHPVTNQHAGATTRDVRFKHFYPRANNKAVNVIDTDKGEPKHRFDLTSLFFLFFSLQLPCLFFLFHRWKRVETLDKMALRRKLIHESRLAVLLCDSLWLYSRWRI